MYEGLWIGNSFELLNGVPSVWGLGTALIPFHAAFYPCFSPCNVDGLTLSEVASGGVSVTELNTTAWADFIR